MNESSQDPVKHQLLIESFFLKGEYKENIKETYERRVTNRPVQDKLYTMCFYITNIGNKTTPSFLIKNLKISLWQYSRKFDFPESEKVPELPPNSSMPVFFTTFKLGTHGGINISIDLEPDQNDNAITTYYEVGGIRKEYERPNKWMQSKVINDSQEQKQNWTNLAVLLITLLTLVISIPGFIQALIGLNMFPKEAPVETLKEQKIEIPLPSISPRPANRGR